MIHMICTYVIWYRAIIFYVKAQKVTRATLASDKQSFSTWSNVVTQFSLELCHLLLPRLDECYHMLSQGKCILWISSNWFWISSQKYSQIPSSALVFWDPATRHPGPFSCCKTGPWDQAHVHLSPYAKASLAACCHQVGCSAPVKEVTPLFHNGPLLLPYTFSDTATTDILHS